MFSLFIGTVNFPGRLRQYFEVKIFNVKFLEKYSFTKLANIDEQNMINLLKMTLREDFSVSKLKKIVKKEDPKCTTQRWDYLGPCETFVMDFFDKNCYLHLALNNVWKRVSS